MPPATSETRRRLQSLEGSALEEHQLARLNALLAHVLPANGFYAEKLAEVRLPVASLEELAQLPFTFKEELLASHHAGGFAANFTFPPEKYVRFHQTSGTRGRPLVVLDTAEDWAWWIDCWQYVLDAAGVTADDAALLAFSFGPFVGFWSACDAAAARGCLVVPGGGLNTLARLELIAHAAGRRSCFALPAMRCTWPKWPRTGRSTWPSCPSACWCWRASRADRSRPSASASGKRGRPTCSITPARRKSARGDIATRSRRGLHVMESEFIAEFLSLETGGPAGEGELAELVLTTLGRAGCPVLRYRTGDVVRPTWRHQEANALCPARRRRARADGRYDDHPRRERVSQRRSSRSSAAFPR